MVGRTRQACSSRCSWTSYRRGPVAGTRSRGPTPRRPVSIDEVATDIETLALLLWLVGDTGLQFQRRYDDCSAAFLEPEPEREAVTGLDPVLP